MAKTVASKHLPLDGTMGTLASMQAHQDDFPLRSTSRFVMLLATTAALSACHRDPPAVPLAPELAAIHCPADRGEHASAMFGKAELTFVCIDKKLADTPSLLRCDPDSRPLLCEDAGSILLRRTADGVVHSGPQVHPSPDPTAPGPGPTDDSELSLNFRNAPPSQPTFDNVETQWRFLLPGGQELLPSGFTFVKGTFCDRAATVLNSGNCNMEARTASLYWNISISVHHKNGTPIHDHEYRTEYAF